MNADGPCRLTCCRNYHRAAFFVLVLFMAGTKTYLVALATAAYGVAGYFLGYHGADVMMQCLLAAGGLVGLRHGITTEVNK